MKAKQIAALITLIIILLAATVAAGVYTNGFESLSAFYLKYDGEIIETDTEIAVSSEASELNFEVKGSGFTAAECEVCAIATGDYVYTYEDEEHSWAGENVTESVITVTESGFTVTPKSVEEIVTEKYGEFAFDLNTVGIEYAFEVRVTSGETTIVLTFTRGTGVTKVEVTPDEIVFIYE